MNILYDYQALQMQRIGGISRYHTDLYTGLKGMGVNCDIGVLYSDNLYLKDCGYNVKPTFAGWEHFITNRYFCGKGTLANLYSHWRPLKGSNEHNRAYIRKILEKKHVDVFHPTYYYDGYDDIETPPIVLTIHDMIYESFPQYFRDLGTIMPKYHLAKKAKRIIAVSQYTKNEILRYYDFLSPNDITVVYHGIDLNKVSMPLKKRSDTAPYLLFVGNRVSYKNFYFLVNAMKEFKKQYKDLKLYCTGNEFSKSENDFIRLLHMENEIVDCGRVSDEELASLYANALAYVSPSLSEGFGIPLLEAMKYESPMLLSDIPVYREIAADAAVYFNPTDVGCFCEALGTLLEERQKRTELINNGCKRIKAFAKEQMIENTYRVYKSI